MSDLELLELLERRAGAGLGVGETGAGITSIEQSDDTVHSFPSDSDGALGRPYLSGEGERYPQGIQERGEPALVEGQVSGAAGNGRDGIRGLLRRLQMDTAVGNGKGIY